MTYMIFETRSGELVAHIDTETGETTVANGYEIIKANFGDVFKKRPGEQDFVDEVELYRKELYNNANPDIKEKIRQRRKEFHERIKQWKDDRK